MSQDIEDNKEAKHDNFAAADVKCKTELKENGPTTQESEDSFPRFKDQNNDMGTGAVATNAVLEVCAQEAQEELLQHQTQIQSQFGPLMKDVWSGEWTSLKPLQFKEALEMHHPQFRGAHQQDCQVNCLSILCIYTYAYIYIVFRGY